MTDQITPNETNEPEVEVVPEGTPDPVVIEPEVEENPGTPDESVPADVLRKHLTDANAEAARYRVRVREVEELLSKAPAADAVQTLESDLAAQREAVARLTLANLELLHGITEEADKALLSDLAKSGISHEALEAHAATLASRASVENDRRDLNGGLDPLGNGKEDYDVVEHVRNRRRTQI